MSGQLGVVVVMAAFAGSFPDGAIDPLDLTVGPGLIVDPGMPDSGQPVFDVVLIADPVEDAAR